MGDVIDFASVKKKPRSVSDDSWFACPSCGKNDQLYITVSAHIVVHKGHQARITQDILVPVDRESFANDEVVCGNCTAMFLFGELWDDESLEV
jgi:transcription elongation factor Elf1